MIEHQLYLMNFIMKKVGGGFMLITMVMIDNKLAEYARLAAENTFTEIQNFQKGARYAPPAQFKHTLKEEAPIVTANDIQEFKEEVPNRVSNPAPVYPSGDYDFVTKKYVDDLGATYLPLAGGKVTGNIIQDKNVKSAYSVGAQYINSSLATGTLKITVPSCTGYAPIYTWVNTEFIVEGNYVGDVRFGDNGSTETYILIGTPTSTWRYPQVTVNVIQIGGSNPAYPLDKNHPIPIITDETGITNIVNSPRHGLISGDVNLRKIENYAGPNVPAPPAVVLHSQTSQASRSTSGAQSGVSIKKKLGFVSDIKNCSALALVVEQTSKQVVPEFFNCTTRTFCTVSLSTPFKTILVISVSPG
ncbi:MAG: hypothetical protein EZS28_044772, partial [Streblomastix strix]